MPEPKTVRIFVSAVSAEFGSYHEALRHDLTRYNVEVKIQEDLKDLGRRFLDELDSYISHCNGAVHFVGDMAGAAPVQRDVRALLAKDPSLATTLPPLGDGKGISYTHWEAWLALHHRKELYIALASNSAERRTRYEPADASKAAQQGRLERLKRINRH